MKAFLLILILLVSGCVAEEVITASQSDASSELSQIRTQLEVALEKGGIHPDLFGELEGKIHELENQGIDVSELDEMLSQLTVGEVAADMEDSKTGAGIVRWNYVDNKMYVPSKTPPECPELLFDSPVDVSKVTSILYPGQYRGADYKGHGGFRFDGQNNNIEVRAPFDGYLVGGARYIESGEVQYIFDFVHECGISYRFDHLLELSPSLQTIAAKLPEPKPDDTRGVFLEPFSVKKGDLIATEVGLNGNVFVDWGVYDFRKENEASQEQSYRTEHDAKRHQAFHAMCWLDYLKEPGRTAVKNLPGADSASGKTSDYC